jgi:hypothetical protein
MKLFHTDLTLSAPVARFYSFCRLVSVTWPYQHLGFMNAGFHSLDFRKLATAKPYSKAFFAFNAVFAFIHNTSSDVQHQQVMRHE